MWWNNDRHNVTTIIFTLFIFLIALKRGVGMDTISGSPQASQLQFNGHQSIRSSSETISTKLLHLRHLVKSLFSDWNFGESLVKGSMERTFGRIRMMRKIMLPLVFMGGFLTAVILSIKFTGLINMILITKVLLLQIALVLGKLAYGAKELFSKFTQPHAYYIPVATHGEHPHQYAYAHNNDLYGQQSSFYGQQLPPPAFQPQFNQPNNYLINRSQNSQPQWNFGQPQSGLPTQTSQQLSQPYY